METETQTSEKKCTWSLASGSTFNTGCGKQHTFEADGDPVKNQLMHCPNCGGRVWLNCAWKGSPWVGRP